MFSVKRKKGISQKCQKFKSNIRNWTKQRNTTQVFRMLMYTILSLSLKNQRNDFSFRETRNTLRLQIVSDQLFECSIDFFLKMQERWLQQSQRQFTSLDLSLEKRRFYGLCAFRTNLINRVDSWKQFFT